MKKLFKDYSLAASYLIMALLSIVVIVNLIFGTAATDIVSSSLSVTTSKETVDIKYHLNGGKFISSQSGKLTSDNDFELPIPVREGYIFEGWCFKNDLSDEPFFKVHITDNLEVYAKWKQGKGVNYTVTHWTQTLEAAKLGRNEFNTDNYIKKQIDALTGYTSTTMFPNVANLKGYVLPEVQPLLVNSDGTSNLDYYYLRNKSNLTFKIDNRITYNDNYDGNFWYEDFISIEGMVDKKYLLTKFQSSNEEAMPSIIIEKPTNIVVNQQFLATFKMGTDNIEFTPILEPKQYTVNYYSYKGNLLYSEKMTMTQHQALKSISDLEDLMPFEDAEFIGWAKSGTSDVIYDDVQYVADLSDHGETVNLYSVYSRDVSGKFFNEDGRDFNVQTSKLCEQIITSGECPNTECEATGGNCNTYESCVASLGCVITAPENNNKKEGYCFDCWMEQNSLYEIKKGETMTLFITKNASNGNISCSPNSSKIKCTVTDDTMLIEALESPNTNSDPIIITVRSSATENYLETTDTITINLIK